MKLNKILSIISIHIFGIVLSQNFEDQEISECKLKYEIDTTFLSKNRFISLKITNLDSKNLKISNEFSDMRIQAINVEKFDNNFKKFILMKDNFTDVNCTNCHGQYIKLRPNKSIIYKLNLDKMYLIEKRLSEPNTKYQFNLFFDTIDLQKYSKNPKCYPSSFESQKIVFETKK